MSVLKLSHYFNLSEFERSQTAELHGLSNKMPAEAIENTKALVENILQPTRQYWGRPITILSGYRSPEVNKLVGSKPTSQHTTGEAADFEMPGVDNMTLAQWIRDNLEFDQLIGEVLKKGDGAAGWIHVSFSRTKNRNEVLSYHGKEKGYVGGLVWA